MRDFISESIKDLSIGFIVGSVIALLIEERASIGAAIVFFYRCSFLVYCIIIKGNKRRIKVEAVLIIVVGAIIMVGGALLILRHYEKTHPKTK